MITLLLEHKSPLDATDNTGYTALHHAIAEGHGALLICREWPVSSPLTITCSGDAAVTLLKAGADSTKRDVEGVLAIDLAPDREVRQHIYYSPSAELMPNGIAEIGTPVYPTNGGA